MIWPGTHAARVGTPGRLRATGCCPSTSFRLRLYAKQGRIQSADYSKFDPINVFLDFLPPKFTLLRIVSGLEAPDRGRVERQLLARFSKRTWCLSEPLRRQ